MDYLDWPGCETPSFRDYMDDLQEAAAYRNKNLCRYPSRVNRRLGKLIEWVTVALAAQELGVSKQRVRELLSHGQIPGAKRKGRPWHIPLHRQSDGKYKLLVIAGKRGPAASYETQKLVEDDGDLPF